MVDVNYLFLPVATSSTNTLGDGCIVAILARRKHRRREDDVVRIGQVSVRAGVSMDT